MPQAIFRINKIKTFGNLAGALSHAYRTRPTPNADLTRTNLIIKYCDPDNFLPAWDAIASGAKITGGGRHASVIAVDILITASPEFFRPNDPNRAGFWDEERLAAFRVVMEPAIEKAFPHALNVMLHLDEATPHYTIIDIPLSRTKTGKPRLSCKAKYGSDDSRSLGLSKWQDWAGETMACLGIERGTPRSQSVHVPPKSYNNELSRALDTPLMPRPKKRKPEPLPERTRTEQMAFTKAFDERIAAEKKYRDNLSAFNADARRVAQETEELLKSAHAKAQSVDRLKKRLEEQKVTTKLVSAERDKFRRVADQLRPLSVTEVIETVYGGELYKDCTAKLGPWQYIVAGESVLVTTENAHDQFLFQSDEVCGKGAIEFVMLCSGVGSRGALTILSEHFDANTLVAEILQSQLDKVRKVVEHAKNSVPPVPSPVPQRLSEVIKYLTGVRGIPQRLVEALIKFGKVWADRFGNAVFPRSGGGAFVHGTRVNSKQVIGGERAGGYVLKGKKGGNAYYVQTPEDAMSVKAANPAAWVCAVGDSLGGLSPEWMPRPPEGEQIYLAFDGDAADGTYADACKLMYPDAERLIPIGDGWNDDLRSGKLLIDPVWAVGSNGEKDVACGPKLS